MLQPQLDTIPQVLVSMLSTTQRWVEHEHLRIPIPFRLVKGDQGKERAKEVHRISR